MLVDIEIDLATRNGNDRVFINNVINSDAYQQDPHQQRALNDMVDSW